jgi:phage shock protein PspC (stress-responsive transcriptional regulator)
MTHGMTDHTEGRDEPMAQQTAPPADAPSRPDGGGGPWQPPPPRTHRRLYRRTDDKLIAGVASGLADYFDIDPVLVRIGFVILAIAGGAGILAYVVMWWLVPATHEVSNPGEDAMRRLKRAPSWVAIALLVIGGVLLANQLGPRHQAFIWGLGLVALGVLLFWNTNQTANTRRDREASRVPEPNAVPTPDAWRTQSFVGPVETAPRWTGSPAGPVTEPGAVPPPPASGFREPPPWSIPDRPRPVRVRSGLGLATFGLALVAVGIAAMLDYWGLFDLSLVQYLALGLTVLAFGLLVGAWVGRARWLIVPAVLLVPFVAIASLVTVPFKGGYGDRTIAPRSIARGNATYRLVAGRMRLDLSHLDFTAPGSATPVHITVTEVAGSLEVVLPDNVPAHVVAEVGAGAMNSLGVYDDGLKVRRETGQSRERALIDLNLAVSFGRIVVTRAHEVVPFPVEPGTGSPGVPPKPTAPAPPG